MVCLVPVYNSSAANRARARVSCRVSVPSSVHHCIFCPDLSWALQALREDPEFKQMFAEIQSGGMGALMKYMNDPKASVLLVSTTSSYFFTISYC